MANGTGAISIEDFVGAGYEREVLAEARVGLDGESSPDLREDTRITNRWR